MRRLVLIFVYLLAFFIFARATFASENSFITIVNPVRISAYTQDPVLSLRSEYAQVADRNLPATWLLTYDVLKNKKMVESFSDFDTKQEFGLFLEISPDYSEDANVIYNKTNSWHRATSLFLSGYTQADRNKLIDTAFGKFKKTFGYFPKSVGAWWVDSYALSYMKSKYKITGVLGVADQYDLDGYQVWGTPYSTVYYPNKLNAAIPAARYSDKLDIVTFRWAARDPINGYLSPTKAQGGLYSIQDYQKNGLPLEYYKKLVELYSTKSDLNDFAQVTIGLEADYKPDTYKDQYSEWMDDAQIQESAGKRITTMAQFSDWYRNQYKSVSSTTVINTPDFLNTTKNIIWVNNNLYRIGIMYNNENGKARIIDFRVYADNFTEPYYYSPNKEYNLSINLPYIIDSVVDKNSAWELNNGKLTSINKNGDDVIVNFENGKIVFEKKSISLVGILPNFRVLNSNQITLTKNNNTIKITPKVSYIVEPSGIIFSNFYPHLPFAIKHRVERYWFLIVPLLVVMLVIFILVVIKNKKLLLYFSIVALLLVAIYFISQFSTKYIISQSEFDALRVLSGFPKGNVLVYDKDCLRCEFTTKLKPAAAAGIKNYISKYSKQRTILDYKFQTAITSAAAKDALKSENIKYIYLPRYESYIESLPYIPEDLGLVKIYENANAQIWEVEW